MYTIEVLDVACPENEPLHIRGVWHNEEKAKAYAEKYYSDRQQWAIVTVLMSVMD